MAASMLSRVLAAVVIAVLVAPSVILSAEAESFCTYYGDLSATSYAIPSWTGGGAGSPGMVYLRDIAMPSLPPGPAAQLRLVSLQILLAATPGTLNLTLALYAYSNRSQSQPALRLLAISRPRSLQSPQAGVYVFEVPVTLEQPPVHLSNSLSYAVAALSEGGSIYANYMLQGLNSANAVALPSGAYRLPNRLLPLSSGPQFPMAMEFCSSSPGGAALGSPVMVGTRSLSPQGGCITVHGGGSGCITDDTWGPVLAMFPLSLSGLLNPFFATSIVLPMGYVGGSQTTASARLALYRLSADGNWTLLAEGVEPLLYNFQPQLPYQSMLVQQVTLASFPLVNPQVDSVALAYMCGAACYEVYNSNAPLAGYRLALSSDPGNASISAVMPSVALQYQPDISPANLFLLGNTVRPHQNTRPSAGYPDL